MNANVTKAIAVFLLVVVLGVMFLTPTMPEACAMAPSREYFCRLYDSWADLVETFAAENPVIGILFRPVLDFLIVMLKALADDCWAQT